MLNLILKEMKKNYTNLEMLIIGIEEIAKNHGFESDTDWEENGEVCIYGGCNVPTLSDVQMLCEELMINHSNIESSDCGIDIWIDQEWFDELAQKSYVPMGQFWHKKSNDELASIFK